MIWKCFFYNLLIVWEVSALCMASLTWSHPHIVPMSVQTFTEKMFANIYADR